MSVVGVSFPSMGERLSLVEQNRALLARQGLLERWRAPLPEVVEAIGALQAQQWGALPVALWSRMHDFETESLYSAFERQELVAGQFLRGTLHAVTAREQPAYSMVVQDGGLNAWQRTKAESSPRAEELREALRKFTDGVTRTVEETCVFIEDWVRANPGAIADEEAQFQRERKWRPFRATSDFMRWPAKGEWGSRTPEAFRAAPCPPGRGPGSAEALETVVRCHIRAFGPVTAEDTAYWMGWKVPPVRKVLEAQGDLLRFTDEAGRTLYDLPDAPRPDAETGAPARFLAPFDSVLLAYEAKRRQRVLPDEHRAAVYMKANLRVLPTFLVDGLVAGLWGSEAKRGEAVLTLRPFGKITKAARRELEEEGERLVRVLHPRAKSRHIAVS
ncbi:Winged helix DNA-binding domain-containing protein [Allokutzneria albata]|uniref:Winged helix DNA-binding domain-containing protein n=2 Tax=Allokutzneria albata TaxID=211114 RepID=A0A1H0AKD3_ALLAB|nr:Winged helix DNA-binding domain-containing protein [Allokutzneria albata]